MAALKENVSELADGAATGDDVDADGGRRAGLLLSSSLALASLESMQQRAALVEDRAAAAPKRRTEVEERGPMQAKGASDGSNGSENGNERTNRPRRRKV